jgi:myosin-7
MGDLPPMKSENETDQIFGPAMNEDTLKDEIYCQIMKQLTENTVQNSEDRGWDLMWLAVGLMTPTIAILQKELQEFLKTRPHPIAKESLQRLLKTMKNGNRKYPPHIVEIEAIRNRSLQIYHKVYFPDDTDEAYQIESSTKAQDIIKAIASNFLLKSSEGFSLFIKIADKVFSIPTDYHIFDFICEINEWINVNLPSRSGEKVVCQYQLFFLRKLWINFVPGKDKMADEIFHFNQEYPKYSNGYYKVHIFLVTMYILIILAISILFFKIPKMEAIQLGAIIYRAYFGNDQSKFQNLQGLINMLIPEDIISQQKPSEWKRQIISVYSKENGMK